MMAVDPKTQPASEAREGKSLTPEERERLAEYGITEQDVARDPMLRFVGLFRDDPEFMPMMRRVFRESRGREIPE